MNLIFENILKMLCLIKIITLIRNLKLFYIKIMSKQNQETQQRKTVQLDIQKLSPTQEKSQNFTKVKTSSNL